MKGWKHAVRKSTEPWDVVLLLPHEMWRGLYGCCGRGLCGGRLFFVPLVIRIVLLRHGRTMTNHRNACQSHVNRSRLTRWLLSVDLDIGKSAGAIASTRLGTGGAGLHCSPRCMHQVNQNFQLKLVNGDLYRYDHTESWSRFSGRDLSLLKFQPLFDQAS